MKDSELNRYITDLFIEPNRRISITQNSLEDFLDQTEHLAISKPDRLCELAIKLEYEEFKEGWKDLNKIYEYAHSFTPNDSVLLTDWIVAALDWYTEYQTAELEKRVDIAIQCQELLEQALKVDSSNASIHHLYGIFYYQHPQFDSNKQEYLTKAAERFIEALDLDRSKQISCLMAAHCFHDLQDWHQALKYYLEVDQTKLIEANQYWTWRAIKLEEQIAFCTVMIGDHEKGKDLLEEFLANVEDLKEDEFDDLVMNFDEAVMALKDLDDPALKKRLKSLILQHGYQKRYQKELMSYLNV